jgi:hypothetical protein
MKNGGEINLGSVSVRTLMVGVKGGSDITIDINYLSEFSSNYFSATRDRDWMILSQQHVSGIKIYLLGIIRG